MPIAFLLAMQAAGMIVDYMGKKEQVRVSRMGEKIEQAGINASIYGSRLEAEEASLQAMKQLRQNLGTQAALFAARGVRSGTPTTALFMSESIGNFNADERSRRINQLGREAELKANMTLSKLHLKTNENSVWNQFRKDAFNKLPSSPEAWNKISEGFSAKNKYGFGISKVGS